MDTGDILIGIENKSFAECIRWYNSLLGQIIIGREIIRVISYQISPAHGVGLYCISVRIIAHEPVSKEELHDWQSENTAFSLERRE